MKDGRTHLAYKAEHAVDSETEAIVTAEVQPADQGDPSTGPQTLRAADENVAASGSETPVGELETDKGYHDNELLAECAVVEIRTHIPEGRQKSRRWDDKPAEFEQAFRGNRRRVKGERGRRLSRWRSERCERAFAHVCETGGGRRAWVRGIAEVTKLHRMRCAAYNLGLLLRKVFGMAKPRCAESGRAAFSRLLALLWVLIATATGPGNLDFVAVVVLGSLPIVVSAIASEKLPEIEISKSGVL